MNLYQIDIADGFNKGGYSGTVEVSEGNLKIEFPTAKMSSDLKRYHLHLLTPDKKNIEFNLLRFPGGEWCDIWDLQFGFHLSSQLKEATQNEIIKMGI